MRRFILIQFLFSVSICFSQSGLEGYIKDKSNDSIIPYCHVFVDSTSYGTISDTSGFFRLDIPDSLSHLNIIVKSLGYEKYSSGISSMIGSSQVIYLNVLQSDLPVFEISASREKKLKQYALGSKKKKNNGNYFFNYGWETALYFDNKEGRKGYVSKVKFFISDKGCPDTPFRVRVYGVDKKSGNPGKEILHQNIISSAVNGNEWVVIDLLNLGIPIPKDGFFVAMEWLPIAEERAYETSLGSGLGGQCLGGTHEFGIVALTYSKGYLGKWNKSRIVPNTVKQLNAKIAVELLVYKQKYARVRPSNQDLVPLKVE